MLKQMQQNPPGLLGSAHTHESKRLSEQLRHFQISLHPVGFSVSRSEVPMGLLGL